MKSHEYYGDDRQQTYIKHFFLERYLERVAYNILSFSEEFVYIDGFSGPWRSENENFEDTSFFIAIEKLKKIQDGWIERGRPKKIRCLFIEKSPAAYSDLTKAVTTVDGLDISTRCGLFEELIPDIESFIGDSFSLTFIDPTGWTGYGLKSITPILRLRGEVIINFMFNDINRFISDPRPETAKSFEPLFGDDSWFKDYQSFVAKGFSREAALISLYTQRLKDAGQIRYATSTRIKKPMQERAYFHLIYTTRHWKGLVEFRTVERRAADEQEQIRNAVRTAQREDETGMTDLFSSIAQAAEVISKPFDQERRENLDRISQLAADTLRGVLEIKYEDLLGILLETPLVWEQDIKSILLNYTEENLIQIVGLNPRETTPKRGHKIRWIG